MSVTPVATFPPSTEALAQSGQVRAQQPPLSSNSGQGSTGEIRRPQSAPVVDADAQDEVKVQWDQPDQIVIYQFVNQQGSIVLQVPSEQLLNLSRGIAQELAQADAPKPATGNEGGNGK